MSVTRNGPLEAPLTVKFVSANPGRIRVPASGVIPAGRESASFAVAVVDDGLVNADEVITVTASAPGSENGSGKITVNNDDKPALALALTKSSVRESDGAAAALGQITRNSDPSAPLVVALTSSDASKIRVPASITIPVGRRTASFDVSTVDDQAPGLPATVSIIASAPGHASASDALVVSDDDTPAISLTLRDSTISEAADNPATFGTVTRTPAGTTDLRVALRGDGPVSVPSGIVIPAGTASFTFPIQVENDSNATGPRIAKLTAIWLSGG